MKLILSVCLLHEYMTFSFLAHRLEHKHTGYVCYKQRYTQRLHQNVIVLSMKIYHHFFLLYLVNDAVRIAESQKVVSSMLNGLLLNTEHCKCAAENFLIIYTFDSD